MIAEKASILYIDDEINNLNSFKAAFRKIYDVFIAESATAGLKLLEDHKIQIIIADQRMPGTTGVDFLETVVKKYPDTIRMLLTGYADMEAVINAINKGHIYSYISKPWIEQEIKIAIDNAFEIYKTRNLLEEKNKQLEKAYYELSRFAYSASHDIRGPLTTILGVINLAKLDAHYENNEYLQMIETTIKKLDDFTQNIINYYKNSRKEEQVLLINFKPYLNQLIEKIKLLQDTSMVEFKINVEQEENFYNDDYRIRLIIRNIISNAIHYRNKNKEKTIIEIDILVKNGIANIKIKDNGMGIPPQHIDHIFEMFYRASQESIGSGLGLYVVKEAVDKMGGTITASSNPGEETCFEIVITSKKE